METLNLMPILSREWIAEATAASLRFLDLAKPEITVPLWSMAYLAPLFKIVPSRFVLWVYGPTGTLKSTLTGLVMSHFGKVNSMNPSATWGDTVRAIEARILRTAGELFWIDDYYENHAYEKEQLKKLGLLIQNLGKREDHAYVVCTGECLPPAAAMGPHLVAVPIVPGDITPAVYQAVSAATKESTLYPQVMAGYLTWLNTHSSEFEAALPDTVLKVGKAISSSTVLQQPGHIPTLFSGYWMGLEFAFSLDLLSETELQQRKSWGWDALINLGLQQPAVSH
jgi:hypothetical protein